MKYYKTANENITHCTPHLHEIIAEFKHFPKNILRGLSLHAYLLLTEIYRHSAKFHSVRNPPYKNHCMLLENVKTPRN